MKKPFVILFRLFYLALIAGVLVFFGKALLFPSTIEGKSPVNQEHYVIPVKSSIIKDALKTLGDVDSSGDDILVTVPTAVEDRLGLTQVQVDAQMYGVTIDRGVERTVISMKKGDGATVLVPVPMLVSLIDRGILTLNPE